MNIRCFQVVNISFLQPQSHVYAEWSKRAPYSFVHLNILFAPPQKGIMKHSTESVWNVLILFYHYWQ